MTDEQIEIALGIAAPMASAGGWLLAQADIPGLPAGFVMLISNFGGLGIIVAMWLYSELKLKPKTEERFAKLQSDHQDTIASMQKDWKEEREALVAGHAAEREKMFVMFSQQLDQKRSDWISEVDRLRSDFLGAINAQRADFAKALEKAGCKADHT